MPRALGIDVGVRKGLDLVLLDADLRPVEIVRHESVEGLGGVIDSLRPDVIAIDSPPRWGTSGGSRRTEQALRRLGIQSFGTPSEERKADKPFYSWMRVGFRAFEVARDRGYPRYRSGSAVGTAIEVFPHASAVVLAGCLPHNAAMKREWRTSVLRSKGVRVADLRSTDQVDAALAALTGHLALGGTFIAPGDPDEGVIVLPVSDVPDGAYRRSQRLSQNDGQTPLPGLARCVCGDPSCSGLTGHEFARGHDAKRKSMLWKLARRGDEAMIELRRRGWKIPPELR
jgi:predicted nuclease with RNAse H fold